MENIQGISSGKTSPARSAPTRARTSSPSSKKSARSKDTRLILLDLRGGQPPGRSWQTISVSHGGYLMRSTGESPNAENVSTLSQILQAGSAGKILFESEGVSGYTPQGFRPWQGTAGTFKESAGASGCVCLNDQGGSPHGCDGECRGNAPGGKPRTPSLRDGGSRFFVPSIPHRQGALGMRKKLLPPSVPGRCRRRFMRTIARIPDTPVHWRRRLQ